MKQRISCITIILLAITFIGCNNKANEDSKEIVAKINIKSEKEPISKYLYGQFIENLGNEDVGNLIDDCLWAEMLDDRKFFYPVDLKEELIPINKKQKINQWKPIYNADVVFMDSLNPYVGIHSPKITITSHHPDGIYQSGIAVENKNYTGRIVLLGTQNIEVVVSLIWGDESNQRESISIKNLSKDYMKYEFAFNCKQRTKNARLEIIGLGNGSFSVGAVSLMPADNIDGFRADVVDLLKGLHSGIYRWGGNFISGYDWRDGVGDSDKRPPKYEYAWQALEDNDVGTHEMIRFSELINVELSLTVNTGFGDAYSAAELVEYVNGSKETPMGKHRAANGHPAPFGIKLWCVGNESYGWWQLGHISLEDYIIKHRMFAEKMREKDTTIQLIASGATIDEMTVTGNALRTTREVVADYGSEADWTGGMLSNDLENIDYMSEHFYCSVDKRFDITVGDYVAVDEPLEDWTRRPANRIKAKAEHYEEYYKRIPELKNKNIPVYLDEWAYYTNWVHPTPTLGVTIGYARALHEMFRNTNLIKMAGFTFGTSCLSFNDTDVIYNTTGLMFKLYQSQFGSIPVAIEGNKSQPVPKWPVGGEQPKINAGGNMYPLDIVAALTQDRKALTIAIVNPTELNQKIKIQLGDLKVIDKIEKWTLSGVSVLGRNIVGKQPEVKLSEETIENKESLEIGASTINIYRYEL